MIPLPEDLTRLGPDEQMILQVKPSPRALIPLFILTCIFSSTVFLVPFALLLRLTLILLYFVSFRPVRYLITTERIIMIRTLLSKEQQDVPLSAVSAFNAYQGVGGRIFHYGTIQPILGTKENSSLATPELDDSITALRSLSHIGNPDRLLLVLKNLAKSKHSDETASE